MSKLRNCRNEDEEEEEEEEEMKKSRVAFAEASSASLDYVDSSDASRYKGTREICEAIMDPIAIMALLYKLNIVKLQLYIVCRLLIVSRKRALFSMIPVTCLKLRYTYATLVYLYISIYIL